MAMNMETVLKIKAQVSGDKSLTGLSGKLGKVSTASGRATTSFGRLRTAASGAMGALRGVLPFIGVAAITAFAKKNLDAADAMSKLSDRTGVAAPRLDQFRKVAELSDTSIESLGRAFPALALNMKTAADTAKGRAFEAFKSLGVSLKDADGGLRAVDDVMLDVSDKFKGMADGAEKSALASSIFGTKLGSELIPLLNSGGEAVRNMGTALTQEFADKAAAFNDRLTNIQSKFGDLAMTLVEALLPVLETLIGVIEPLVNAFTFLPEPLQTLIVSVGLLGGALLILSPLIGPIAAGFTALAGLQIGATIAGWLPVLAGLVGTLKAVGLAIVGILSGPVGIAILIGAVIAAIFVFRDDIASFFSSLFDLFAKFASSLYEKFVQPYIDAFNAVVKFVKGEWLDSITEAFEGVSTWLGNTAESIIGLLLFPYKAAAAFVVDIFPGLLTDALGGVISAIGKAWSALVNFLQKPFDDAVSFVKSNFISPISNAVSNVVDAVGKTWSELTKPFQEPFEATIKFVDSKFISPLGQAISNVVKAIGDAWKPIAELLTVPFQAVVDFLKNTWSGLGEIVAAPFTAAANAIQGVLNSVLGAVGGVINAAVEVVNNLIKGANAIASAVGIPSISLIGKVNLPEFAEGGVVKGPTVALVGEGGEPEYIVPQSKADGFVQNWMNGRRGASAIPAFAEGGFVSAGPSAPTVQITTGPVIQQDGQTYVSSADLERALTTFGKSMIQSQRSAGSRRYLGA